MRRASAPLFVAICAKKESSESGSISEANRESASAKPGRTASHSCGHSIGASRRVTPTASRYRSRSGSSCPKRKKSASVSFRGELCASFSNVAHPAAWSRCPLLARRRNRPRNSAHPVATLERANPTSKAMSSKGHRNTVSYRHVSVRDTLLSQVFLANCEAQNCPFRCV